MRFEERFRVGDDFLGRDAEQVARALADIGVANIPVGFHHALVDDPGNCRHQRGKPLIGGAECRLALRGTDREADK